jgi:hypothetical protein
MQVSTVVEAAVVKHAQAHVAWGHRKVWAMTRYDGHQVSPATVLRIMRPVGCCWLRTTSGSGGSWPRPARPPS